jgi:hypothetical protein
MDLRVSARKRTNATAAATSANTLRIVAESLSVPVAAERPGEVFPPFTLG